MKRWVCPNCRSGALAPERPVHDDSRVFCFTCSRRTGRLVRRVCPSLEKARVARRTVQREDARKGRAKARERDLAFWTVAGLDVRKVAAKCWKALGKTYLPPIKLRRRSDSFSTGRAYSEHRIVLSFGSAADPAKVWELTLHELTHLVVGCHHMHDEEFNRIFSRASIKLWEIGLPIERGYGPSQLLVRALRARFAREAGKPLPNADEQSAIDVADEHELDDDGDAEAEGVETEGVEEVSR